jgi:dTDP-4-amino-4,6-dideoxygalactose transaminase
VSASLQVPAVRIPFNKPFLTGREGAEIAAAMAFGHLSGDGPHTRRARQLIEAATGASAALLTPSCTAALEMAALLTDLAPGDEVIMPSYTFVSTANAFALRGAVPVFVDVEPGALGISPDAVEAAIGPRTKAVCIVHYAGIACDMVRLMEITTRHGLTLVEDAAQGFGASFRGQALGTFGRFGALSFHETKNIISGEGGALLLTQADDHLRAEIVREKGTNRTRFIQGVVDKYTWLDRGSSYLPAEIVSAFLVPQLEDARAINARRMALWQQYHAAFEGLEAEGFVRRPVVPAGAEHNGHIYFVVLPTPEARASLMQGLAAHGIRATSHYVPLHEAPFANGHARAHGDLGVTSFIAPRLLRLPLWPGMESHLDEVVDVVLRTVRDSGTRFS